MKKSNPKLTIGKVLDLLKSGSYSDDNLETLINFLLINWATERNIYRLARVARKAAEKLETITLH